MHVLNQNRVLGGVSARWGLLKSQRRSNMRRLSFRLRGRVVCGVLLLLIAQCDVVNEFARQALWIHAVQSVLLHHVVPSLVFSGACSAGAMDAADDADYANCSPYIKLWSTLAALAFATISVVWMIPVVHALAMRSAVVLSAMSASMLLSGTWLVLAFRNQRPFATRSTLFWMLCVTPVASLGLELCLSTPLYAFDMALCRSSAGPSLGGIAWVLVHSLSWSADQRLAGGLYLFTAGWHGLNYARNTACQGATVQDWKIVQSGRAKKAV